MVCSMVSASACHSEESLSEASPPRGSCHPEGEVFSFSPDQAVPRGAAAAGKSFDELGVLLPIHQFENRMLQHLSMIDGLVLSCREQMIRVAGADSLDL